MVKSSAMAKPGPIEAPLLVLPWLVVGVSCWISDQVDPAGAATPLCVVAPVESGPLFQRIGADQQSPSAQVDPAPWATPPAAAHLAASSMTQALSPAKQQACGAGQTTEAHDEASPWYTPRPAPH